MEASDGSPPQSLCMIRAAELFPKLQMEKEDKQLTVPFQELAGESVRYLGRTDDGILALSNYRIFLLKTSNSSEMSVPLGLIETVQSRDLFHLIINCKDASTVKCSFETAEQCSDWQRRIQLSVGVPDTLESLFAFPFCSWTCDVVANGASVQNVSGNNGASNIMDGPFSFSFAPDYTERLQRASRYDDDFMREVERLGFDLNGPWRISQANEEFKLCPSYPQKILVPCCISDETLYTVANYRGSRRLPAVVWRHRKSGAVIARCSQPEVGWLGWRNAKDEQLLKALADACAFDRGEQMRRFAQGPSGQSFPSGNSSPSSPDSSHEEVAMDEVRKILIVDARSYTSAVTNRARGGGCECIEYYPCAEIEFMNLGNIHVIRKSFQALRQLCASPPDMPNWLGLLEKTMWLQHLSGLLAASMTVCHAIEKKGRPVLVHCSDGWDRTPQIVATAELCLDPFYRTVEGFRILVEREWLNYGHKFADRCGHGPGSDEQNERCPVFLQWLDLVHQIHRQFPCCFEFSMGYLIKLAQHSLSCLFGTFFCNTLKERIENSVFERTFSVWPFLASPLYRNQLYVPNKEKVLWPAHNVRNLSLWTEVYWGSLGNQNGIDFPTGSVDGIQGATSPMAKTRSYGDLITAGVFQTGISRRSSDPNMSVDANLIISSNSENNLATDIQSERVGSHDIIANFIHDTTKKLENLTIELNNHDEDNFQNIAQQKDDESTFENNEALALDNTLTMPNCVEFQERLNTYDLYPSTSVNTNEQPSLQIPNGSTLLSSLQISKYNTIGCEFNSTSSTPMTSLACVKPSAAVETKKEYEPGKNAADVQINLNDFHNTLKDNTRKISNNHNDRDQPHNKDGVHGTITETVNQIRNNVNLDLMQSVDLGDICFNSLQVGDDIADAANNSDNQENMWHGSVNTSTDTLVPIDTKQQNQTFSTYSQDNAIVSDVNVANDINNVPNEKSEEWTGHMIINSANQFPKAEKSIVNTNGSIANNSNTTKSTADFDTVTVSNASTNCSILPKVHSSCNQSNILSTSSSNASVSSTSSSLNNLYTVSNNVMYNTMSCDAETIAHANPMEESILILPEHQKLEISISGKCETVMQATATTAAQPTTVPFQYGCAPYSNASVQRRRRTSSSNSRRDCYSGKQVNGSSTISQFSMSGVRSLPMTPPGVTERSQSTISSSDGLAHALSEQNIRLQQIVHEHKLREDVLLREIHDMRMVLLKKICPSCNNAPAANDEQEDDTLNDNRRLLLCDFCKCYTVCAKCSKSKRRRCHGRHDRRYNRSSNEESNDEDSCECDDNGSNSVCSALDGNVENVSICSWEAVEDRSGPSSCTSSSIQPSTTNVLWVPDHAVSRCTSCQTEFWLGRRKHHCRSCGQIFCADCSEFCAPLPDEKLFSPVRLCGPCYHSVTTRMQVSQLQNNALLQLQLQESVSKSASNAVAAATAAAATSKA